MSRIRTPSSSHRILLASLLVCLHGAVGCASGSYRFPGPLRSLGEASESGRVAAGGASNASGDTRRSSSTRTGTHVARIALRYLDGPGPWGSSGDFRDDCSGFVEGVYSKADIALEGSSADLWETAHEMGVFHERSVPWIGDVVFFENTWDRNGNGRVDDGITHVGIVVGTSADGTVSVVHRGGSGISSLTMNLQHRDEATGSDGRVWNDNIRRPNRKDPKGTRYGAGELWSGFASFWRALDTRS